MPLASKRLSPSLLLLLTLLSYSPAIFTAGFIWDDPDYVTHNALLRTPTGLVDIWTKPSALPQYYPLVHTTYWLEYQLTGLSPHLYHLTNVLLHAASAILLHRILRTLQVPGALLAAAIFATHPLMTESVAWVTERKNTLSLFFYLASFLAYWRFATAETVELPARPSGRWTWYAASLLLFLCAMLSKTVTCSLPAAIILVLWWQRRLTRRTTLPLLPFFLIGLPLALYTAHLEQTHVGATGAQFAFSIPDRLLIASRATLFYLTKLLVPYPLSFIYPRWKLNPSDALQWIPLLICLAITAALAFSIKRLGRAPLTAWLLFVGTLTPALGFFNVYPMRYSFVADHFAYHATLAPIALLAASLTLLAPKPGTRNKELGTSLLLILPLAALTFTRCHAYRSPLTLWTDTARKNPDSWMVHVNLGHALVTANDLDAAEQHYNRAAQLAPDQPEAIINVGGMLAKRGRHDDAIAQYNRALAVRPDYPPALFGIGDSLLSQRNPAAAREYLRRAVLQDPTYEQAQYKLGVALEQLNDPNAARAAYDASIAADPEEADAMYNLANLYRANARLPDAVTWYRRALAVRPARADYHANLAAALWQLNDRPGAIAEYTAAARLDPALAPGIRHFLTQQGVAPNF